MADSFKPDSTDKAEFRWQKFFQRTSDPFFLLNRQRRVLFVNRAWAELTGLTLQQARELTCRRQKPAAPDNPWQDVLEHVLCPPPEVLEGKPGRSRRFIPGAEAARRWWDIEFFPLRDGDGLLAILGRIVIVPISGPAHTIPLPERIVALRQQVAQRYSLDSLTGSLPSMHRVVEQVRLASRVTAGVLLVGEAGTGKQWVARTIHQQGPRAEHAFVSLDCTGLPVGTLSSVLFGERGLVRASRVGTVYLREPSNLPRDLQLRLCEWLMQTASAGKATGPRMIAGCRNHPIA